MAERIQKVLARAGFGSRRQIEQWIESARVEVDGKPATLGQQIDTKSRVKLDGQSLPAKRLWQAPKQVLLYHKPIGEVCTRQDPEGRRTIFESLPSPQEGRWVSVGRLDLNTSGLILLTTDGELANRLMHPSTHMDREYAVRVLGEVTPEMMQTLRDGVQLEDGDARFTDIQPAGGEGANSWFHVVIQEGRNREVRRLWESQGVQVSRLTRLRYGPVIMPNRLKPGRWMMLEGGDLDNLYIEAGLKTRSPQKTSTGRSVRSSEAKPTKGKGKQSGRSKPESVWRQSPNRAPRSKAPSSSNNERGGQSKPKTPRLRGVKTPNAETR